MRMRINKRWFIAVAALTAATTGGGVAYAAWTATGSGTGTALAVTAQPVTINAVALSNSSASLFPGGPAGNVFFTVTNPNPYPVKITNIAWSTPTSNNPTSCPNSVISIDSMAPTSGFNLPVPANSTSSTIEVNGVLDLSSSAGDGCQGIGFNVTVTVTGVQLP